MYYSAQHLITMMSRAEGFKSVPAGYHIIGVRSEGDASNTFDDTFHLMRGEKLIMSTTGTTNPGITVLKNYSKYNKHGAAVLESNRVYNNVWKFGKHAGKIPGLKQLGASVVVWRDGNKNNKSEEIGKRMIGYYGINFHCDQYNVNGPDKVSTKINGWSAGCQVCNIIADYNQIITCCKPQKYTTYTLLNEFSV